MSQSFLVLNCRQVCENRMLNKDLMLSQQGGSGSYIGEAGKQGFGVGVFPGKDSALVAMGLSPMDGCADVTSDNYGNYVHTNGSVMVFIPAFCYRVGNSAAPSYSRDGSNALEIRSAAEFDGFNPGASFSSADMGDGWILHRAFVDGGLVKSGFFIDKYLCSKSGNDAVSVKNADPLSTSANSSYNPTSGMTDCEGKIYDAITLSRARGDAYACVSCFQWSAIAMLSLAHGQAATSTEACAWYDGNHSTNFPKGNSNSLKDTDDSSVSFTKVSYSGNYSKTGSGSPFAKTTHNGQNSGITDINGNKWQPLLGWQSPSAKTIKLFGTSVRMHDVTKDTRTSSSYLTVSASIDQTDSSTKYWGSNAFYTGSSLTDWSINGIHPRVSQTSGTSLFGKDYVYLNYISDRALLASGYCDRGSVAGVWCRNGGLNWLYDDYNVGFRAAGYAQ